MLLSTISQLLFYFWVSFEIYVNLTFCSLGGGKTLVINKSALTRLLHEAVNVTQHVHSLEVHIDLYAQLRQVISRYHRSWNRSKLPQVTTHKSIMYYVYVIWGGDTISRILDTRNFNGVTLSLRWINHWNLDQMNQIAFCSFTTTIWFLL